MDDELDAFLKKRGVWLEYTVEDFRREGEITVPLLAEQRLAERLEQRFGVAFEARTCYFCREIMFGTATRVGALPRLPFPLSDSRRVTCTTAPTFLRDRLRVIRQ